MTYETLDPQDHDGVRTIWLNRPDVRNALNAHMITELNDILDDTATNPRIRVIVLAGRGKAFCSGADLSWMKSGREMSPADAAKDTARLARVMRAIYDSKKPTLARVHGSAFAGAMGLVAGCDIAIGSEETKFCLSEVKLGLIPGMISPYVIKAIGESNARRYMLTAEVFQAPEAKRIGLLDECVPAEQLDATTAKIIEHLLAAGPDAQAQTKRLIRDVVNRPIDDALSADTAERISVARASDEAQEGINAFFEKRRPSWVQKQA